jgi:TBC1 domain family protein 5
MWDALFAIDPSLELVDMISVTMLLRIRWQLVDADTNEAFSLLLRYPEPDAPAYTFIKDALYLRDHLTPEGGAEIITRYGKRAPFIEETPPQIHLPPPSPSFGSSRTRNGLASPKNFITQQSGGIEGLIQNAAKGVLDRGSQWGVGKAIRDAVGEVKKNVEAYQTGAASPPVSGQSTPRAGGREYRKPARIASDAGVRPSLDRTLSANVVRRVEGLEKRNKGLAKMLESAVGELWEYHRQRSENAKENQDALEMLSLAIAKVQFVQVYLEDSSIPLPVDETTETGVPSTPNLKISDVPEPTPSMPPQTSNSRSTSSATNAPDTSLLSPTPRPNSPSTQGQSSSPGPSSGSSSGLPSTLPSRTRPLLSSANFSWMLGENSASESTRSAFAKASEHSAFSSDEKRRMRGSMGKGYLFGDDDDDDASSPVEARDKRASISGKVKGKKDGHVEEVEEEIIDLGELGKKGAVS